jgi:hypothetical protein
MTSAVGHAQPRRFGEWHVRSYLNCGCAKTSVATPASGPERRVMEHQSDRSDVTTARDFLAASAHDPDAADRRRRT